MTPAAGFHPKKATASECLPLHFLSAGVCPGHFPDPENDRYHRQVTVTFPGMITMPSDDKTKHSFFIQHPSSFLLRVACNLVILPGPE